MARCRKSSSTLASTASAVVPRLAAIALTGRPLRDELEHALLVGREPLERPRRCHQRLDDLGIEHRPAGRDLVHGADQPVAVRDPLLQQVRETRGALGQQGDGVLRVVELRQHHDARAGLEAPYVFGGRDPFVGERRRHPDVGDDDVRPVLFGCRDKPVVVFCDRDDRQPGPHGQQRPDSFPHEDVVVRQQDTQDVGTHVRCGLGCRGWVADVEFHRDIASESASSAPGHWHRESGGGGTRMEGSPASGDRRGPGRAQRAAARPARVIRPRASPISTRSSNTCWSRAAARQGPGDDGRHTDESRRESRMAQVSRQQRTHAEPVPSPGAVRIAVRPLRRPPPARPARLWRRRSRSPHRSRG